MTSGGRVLWTGELETTGRAPGAFTAEIVSERGEALVLVCTGPERRVMNPRNISSVSLLRALHEVAGREPAR